MDTRPCDNCGKFTVFALCDACKSGGLARSAARIMMLSEPDFEAKLAEIRARGAARIAEAKAKEDATRPPADVRDPSTGLPVVGSAQGLPLAPVRDVGAERGAECLRGYDLALAHSLKAAHHTIQEVAKKRDLSVADALEWVRQGLAEDWKRLWVESSVAVGRKE